MDSKCRIYPRVDVSQDNAMAEIQQVLHKNREYIDSKFRGEGMFDNFKEYMSRNCWREENGDMLTYQDFMRAFQGAEGVRPLPKLFWSILDLVYGYVP